MIPNGSTKLEATIPLYVLQFKPIFLLKGWKLEIIPCISIRLDQQRLL